MLKKEGNEGLVGHLLSGFEEVGIDRQMDARYPGRCEGVSSASTSLISHACTIFVVVAFSLALYFKRHLSIAADENKESFTILPLVLLLLFAFSILKTLKRYQQPQGICFHPLKR